MARLDRTKLLIQSSAGDALAKDRLMGLVYEELRRLAKRLLARERAGHTLQPTALVHEAYTRLVQIDRIDFNGRTHFLAMGAQVMRRVLVESARAHRAMKRGGGAVRMTLYDAVADNTRNEFDALVISEALDRLASLNPRHARLIELRFFGGLQLSEIAIALGVTPRTLKRDWRVARNWLYSELTKE